MKPDRHNVSYCILLTPEQLEFLSDPLQGTSRCATLLSMVAMANIEEEGGDEGDGIHAGQLSVPIIKLADQWSVNPKTARKLVERFNEQKLVSTESDPSGSVHTMLCLSGRIRDGKTIRNPFYRRPVSPLKPADSDE